ncbi:MAG: hypothetical protein HOC20_10360 [Chloroflexi bacterium]|jgi:hypothetical protein|nr:hypothetical protein [Chloroflexota bacterium]
MRFGKNLKTMGLVKTLAIMVITLALGVGLVSELSAEAGSEIEIGQAMEIDGVVVTLESIDASDTETLITYRYKSTSGLFVEPLGLPTIHLDDGTKYIADAIGIPTEIDVNEIAYERKAKAAFPLISGETKVTAIDLGSYLVYTSKSGSVELTLGDAVHNFNALSDGKSQVVSLNERFSIEQAKYRFTDLKCTASDTDPGFVLVYEPMNDVASQTVLVGGLSDVKLRDDLGNEYFNTSASAKWYPDDGQKMKCESLHFEGLPNAAATTFSLEFSGIARITDSYVFDVNVRK